MCLSSVARRFFAVPVLALLSGCGGSATAPSRSSKQPSPPSLVVTCVSAPALTCGAFLYGEGDVTARASWSAAESFRLAMDLPVTPSNAVVFRTPGVPTAIDARNVYVRADYTSPRWPGGFRSIAPHAYAVSPDGSAEPLAYISGTVFAGPPAPGTPLVGDATVAIVSGEGAGASQVTRENGSYLIEFLRLGAPFTIRASKAGYSSDTRDHPGIADDSLGYPSNTAIHFNLEPTR